MLGQLLSLLRDGGSKTVDDLARELGVTPALVEAMLEDLDRRGYLRTLAAACPGHCGGCPAGATCAAGGGTRRWGWVYEAHPPSHSR